MIKYLRIAAVALLAVALIGCSKKPDAAALRRASRQALAAKETLWVATAYTSADLSGGRLTNLKTDAVTGNPPVLTTAKGQLTGGYTKIGLAAAKKLIAATPSSDGAKPKLATLAQLNRALAGAKAKFRLTDYGQLTIYQFKGATAFQGAAYIAHGDSLYILTLAYSIQKGLPVVNRYVKGELKVPAKHLADTQLSGRWTATDGSGSLDAAGDWLYHTQVTGTYTSVERFKVQDLRAQSAKATYTTTFATFASLAAVQSYGMPKATTRAASDGTAIYLFLTATDMVKLSQDGVTTYHKQAGKASAVPAETRAVFTACDKQKGVQSALAVSPIASHQYEIVFNDPARLSNYYQRELSTYRFAAVAGGVATLRDHE
ncbi:hypothetical protein [Lacticaseibacillus kribbianus]|uniref:hypothetical protein n=1 Tax=Lacticaseibacillus kribbianus TaxID=2926292 RepID=UPI001CD57C48|nr:hypothetical protein [Lacticaseibacillus kribbianus]